MPKIACGQATHYALAHPISISARLVGGEGLSEEAKKSIALSDYFSSPTSHNYCIATETRTPSGYSSFQTSYGYDRNGNLTSLVYPSGRTAAMSYDNEDEVSAISAIVNGTSSTIASSLSYYPFGPRASLTFGNSLVDARTYDSRYRMGNWTLGSLISKTYTWQDDDNITGITDNLNSANNRTFGYDAIHRLTTANGPWGSGSYSYDANGNRLTKIEGVISTSYTYNSGTNRVATATGSEPATYSYDSNGNITNDATHTYQFSQRNRLETVDTGTTATYSHDGDGRRVKKVAGGTTTLYFYDAEGKLIEEYIPATGAGKDYLWMPKSYEPAARIDFSMTEADTGDCLRASKSSPDVVLDWSIFGGSGNFIVRRGIISDFGNYTLIFGPSSLKTCDDAVLEDTTSYWYDNRNRSMSDTLYFYHADHLGTPIAMTDTSGLLVWKAEHAPFGGIYALTVGTIPNNLRFPGQYFDPETGLAQNWFRDYDAKTGRYWEVDPRDVHKKTAFKTRCRKWFRFEKGHPYLYGENNPLGNVDYRGLVVRTYNCSPSQTASIIASAGKAEAASKTCLPCEDREPFKKHIRDLLVFCSKSNMSLEDPGQEICGEQTGEWDITLTPLGLSESSGCGCLQSTIMHEVLHQIGYLDKGANNADERSGKCFNCNEQ